MKSMHLSARRRGMTIIEVMFAIVILSGVMLALSRFGQGFARANRNAANLAIASDLASARLEAIKAHGNYGALDTLFDGSETSASLNANPSMSGYTGFTRVTKAVRTANDSLDYVTVTVTVTASVLSAPMRKSVVIGAF
jgi:prepilin-type N-terminal cleavage/methylation domain-containing protein